MTNPFTPQPAAPPAPSNPYAQPTVAPVAPVAPSNPFAAGVPAQPYGQQAPAAAAPQAYAPAPAQAPAAAPPALNMSGLQAAGAPVVGEGGGAKLADMYGRLVLVFPLGVARVPRNPQFITQEQRNRGDLEQDRMTATVVVLDDGQGGMQPIAYGGAPYALPPKPHTESAPLPYVRKGMWINQSRLISQLRDFIAQPGQAPGMICGRVVKAGPAQNDPWYLDGAKPEELALAGKYLEMVQAGHFTHPLA
jgi:hypothetical protein